MKLKKVKPFLIATGSLVSVLSVASLISCETNEEKTKRQEDTTKKELNDVDLTVGKSKALQGPMSNKYPRDLLNNDVTVTSKLPDGITSEIMGISDRNDKTGTIVVNVKLTKNNISVERKVTVEGFSSNPFGSDRDLNSLERFATPIDEYSGMTQLQRFQVDNDKYLKFGPLTKRDEGQTPKEGDPKPGDPDYGLLGVYSRLKATKEQLAAYDKKASENDQDSYANSKRKGFTVPVFDSNGNVTGLQINEGEEVNKGPSWLDRLADPNNSGRLPVGLARTLPNAFYKEIALQTFSLQFNNPKKNKDNLGTTWILDYQIPTDSKKYPTKWYFATNAHVADKLRLRNDVNYPTKAKDDDLTSTISFTRITNSTPIQATLSTTKREPTIQRWGFNAEKNPGAFRTVYQGFDFLKTSPKDYLEKNSKYENAEEFADFAVIEVDFSKIKNLSDVFTSGENKNKKYTSAEELAKDLTNDYADNKKVQIKFATSSYLANYKKAEWPLQNNDKDRVYKRDKGKWDYDGLFAVGYPNSRDDGFLDPYQDAELKEDASYYASLWVNGNSAWYDNLSKSETTGKGNFSEEVLKRGNTLSYALGYRSFKNLPGVTDLFIAAPKIGGIDVQNGKKDNVFKYEIDNPMNRKGSELIDSFTKDPKVSDNFNNEYLYYGLNYMPRQFSPAGGASGSSIRTQDNVVVSILHATTHQGISATSLSQAFRSEGVDYGGIYGNYKLEQYDLIYGGGKNQRTSYRQALAHLYGNDSIKTNLFPEGLKDSEVPVQYRFGDKPYLKATDIDKEV